MSEQFIMLVMILLIPWEITAEGPTEEEKEIAREAIRIELMKAEEETRAIRQQKTGHGL